MENQSEEKKVGGFRFYLGVALLVLSFIIPLSSVWIIGSSMPAGFKAVLVGLVTVGGPEVIGIAAIALLGKECFERIVAMAKSLLKRLAPSGSVSKLRYKIGLAICLLSFLPNYAFAYFPDFVSCDSPYRIYIAAGSDIAFIVSLFILGGDFWDKLRALFIYEAKAEFPKN